MSRRFPGTAASAARRMSPRLLAQLGGGAAAVLLGVFPLLAGFGLIETEGEIEPFARVVAVLFGGVFLTIGGAVLASPLLATARTHGARTWPDAARLGLRHMLRRPTAASWGAALGLVPLAAGYWLGAAGVTLAWLGGTDGLRALVIIEFLVIHGFPFLVIAAWLVRITRGRVRAAAGGALALLALLYGAMAWKAADGPGGLLALLYLMVPNVVAFSAAESSGSARVLVTSRWVIKFGLLIVTSAILGGGSFNGPEAIWIGAVYFTVLLGVETFRIIEVPGELAGVP